MKKFIRAIYALVFIILFTCISTELSAQYCSNSIVHYGEIDVVGKSNVVPHSIGDVFFNGPTCDLSQGSWSYGINEVEYVYDYTEEEGGSYETMTGYKQVQILHLPPDITTSLSGLNTSSPDVSLSASPSGGTFSGIGVTGSVFSPSDTGEGTFTIYYKYSSDGCEFETSKTVPVTQAITITGFSNQSDICQNAGLIIFSALPSGGTYSGTGVSGNTFNPTTAGGGVHSITYTVSGVSKTIRIDVTAVEQAYLTLPVSEMYPTDSPLTLSGGTPSGGTYSGSGVSGNTFDPSIAGEGTHTISYKTESGSCAVTATDAITISKASVNIPPQTFCDGESYTAPADGGVFYYNGSPISSTFTSAIFGGAGTYTIVWKKTGFEDAAVVVNILSLPNTNFSGASFCQGDGSINLSSYASPSGGTFSGSGVSGTTFNANGSAGSYSLSYDYDNGSCSNTAYATFSITAQPSASLNLSTTSVYQDASSFTLSGGSPSGGTYYVDGAARTSFNPSSYSVGNHTVTYTVGSGSCTDSDSEIIRVLALGTISYSDMHLCVTDATVTLNDNSGTFYIGGSVLSNDRFNPSAFGAGTYTVTWKRSAYSDETFTITVHALPSVSLSSLPSRCVTGSSLSLSSYGNPSGGSFSGTGVSGSIFNPATAGVAAHTITYSYSDSYCTNSASRSITVYGPTSVNLTAPNVSYTDDSPVSLLSYSTPSGGTFQVNGTTTNTLTPSSLGTGTHTITYSYTNAGACTTTESATVTLIEKGSFAFTDLSACTDDADISLSANGGTYTISGTDIGTTFSPSTYGAGSYLVTWKRTGYTDANFTITVTQTPSISVSAVPIQCYQGAAIDLLNYVSPATGSFSGSGVSGTLFTPANAGAGTHTISYTVTNGSCYDEKFLSISVIGVASVSLSGDDAFCSTDLAVDLSSYPNHTGGTFSSNTGGGLAGSTLYPDQIAAGSCALTYTLNVGTACEQSDNMTLIIMDPPAITLSDFDSVYVDEPNFPLSGGNPSGGQYYVDGTLTSTFNASQLGEGSYAVRYEVSNSECTSFIEKTIRVLALQTNNFQDRNLCLDQGIITLTENGGTFTVDGTDLVGGEFDPMIWGAGAWEITWSKQGYADTRFTINVIDNEPVIVTAVDDQCIYGDPIDLFNYVTPRTGTFSGNGLIGSAFAPSVAKAGDHQILYTVNNDGCYSESVLDITVIGVESLEFSGINGFCSRDASIDLTPYVNHTGGTFASITGGVAGNFLYPELMTEGNHKISYTINVGSGCEQADSIEINIMNPPVVSLVNYESVYVDAATSLLYGGSPAGGQYYVDGSLTNIMNPALLGIGVHTVKYVYSNSLCENTAETTIEVLALNTNSFTDREICIDQGTITLTENGGKFSIDGTELASGIFDPSFWGVGSWDVRWKKDSYADTRFTLRVRANPTVSVADIADQCVFNPSIDLMSYVEPKTGTFSGNGITGSIFEPSSARVGVHTILYTVNNNGCYTEVSIPIIVSGVENLDFSGINGFCSTDGAFDLSPYVNQSGGTFSSATGGIGGTTLYPEQLGDGAHTLKYTINLGAGCEQSDSIDIFVMSPPAVSLNDFDSVYVDAASFPLYGGFPSGGQYYVNDQLTGTLNAGQLGIGVHTIRYVYSNAVCSNFEETSIEVKALRSNNFQNQDICVEQGAITFTENGGTFSIDGTELVGGVFDPASWSVGSWEITWKKANYADSKFTVTVLENLSITYALPVDQCINGNPIDLLNYVEPKTGTFTGNGISGNLFYPSVARAGEQEIMYTVNNNGCYSETTFPITVIGVDALEFSGINGYCATHEPVDLSSYVSHEGGVFSSVDGGIYGNTLYPEQLSQGNHTLVYTLNVGTGCEQTDSISIHIMNLPTVTLPSYDAVYADASNFRLYGGSPSGGQYYIDGELSNTFNPSLLGVGLHTVEYVYSNSLCENTARAYIEVLSLQTNSYNDYNTCIDDTPLSLTENGGTFSIDGTDLAGGVFEPMEWGPGEWEVSWRKENFSNTYFTITVHYPPTIFYEDMEVCLYDEPIPLTYDFGGPTLVDSKIDLKSASASGAESDNIVYMASGQGIRNFETFYPEDAGPGTHEITILVASQYCFSEKTISITVTGVEGLAFTGLNSFCSTDVPVELTDYLAHSGGTFYCADGGVSGKLLYPEQLSEGTHTIEYILNLANSCTQQVRQDIYIMDPPVVNLPQAQEVYVDQAAFPLYGGSPSGGQYYVNGQLTDIFDPSVIGIGTHSIRYVYSNSLCESSDETSITVLPMIGNFSDRTICFQSNTVEFPDDGGTYSINGVDINRRFNPAVYGIGTFKVTWKKANYADVQFDITVVANPEVSFLNVGAVCKGGGRVELNNYVYPSGGMFTGKGIEQNQYFNPEVGHGTYEVLYTVAGNACVTQKKQSIYVDLEVDFRFTSPSVLCSDTEEIDLNNFVNVDGVSFSGTSDGMINNYLYPELMEPGKYEITADFETENGCFYTQTRSVYIVEPAEVYINGLNSTYYENDNPFFLTGGTPEGGTYAVDGVPRTVFDPATFGVGVHTLTYTYSTVNGCESGALKTITIEESGVDYYTDRTICLGEKLYLPEHGGIFYINSAQLNEGIFESTIFGAGEYTVTWEKEGFADATFKVTVNDVPDVMSVKIPDQCLDNGAIDLLSFVEPKTGTFSGPGLVNSTMFEALYGTGDYSILYTVSNENCYVEHQLDITVNKLANVSFTGLNLICQNSFPIDLRKYVSPAGGVFSTEEGAIIDNTLYPSMLSEGAHRISYTVESDGCIQIEEQLVYIIKSDSLVFNESVFSEVYANDAAIYLDIATPKGGKYYVDGVRSNVFEPSILGQGAHRVLYTYEDNLSACTEEKEIVVNILGEKVTNFRDMAFCQNDAPFAFTLDGGSIYIDNMQLSTGSFEPSIYAAGTYNAIWRKAGFTDTEFSITVYDVPDVTYVDIPKQCADNGLLELSNFVEPKTGSFSGPGLESSTVFNPAIGEGDYSILYTLTNERCYTEVELKVKVNELEDVEFYGLNLVCQDAAPVDLKQFVSPTGGIFSCNDGGVIDDKLYPSMLSEGAHTIIYTVESAGCIKSENQLMYIVKPEEVVFGETQLNGLYANSAAVYLDFATPVGGDYYVNGEQSNIFDPSVLGQGAHKVRYSYLDVLSSCTHEKEMMVSIAGEKRNNFRDRSFCQNDAAFEFAVDGGTVYVDNVPLHTGTFDPSLYSAGTYSAVWRKDGSADSEFSISVYSVPKVIYVEVPDQCSDNTLLDLSNFVEPKTGSFSGPGLESTTMFNPAIGKGQYSILYNLADEHCYSDLEMQITVNELEDVEFNGLHLVCQDESPIDLRQFVSPSGGDFYCAEGGVMDNTLYPSLLSEGAHTITYTLEASGCTKTEEQLMYVVKSEEIVFNADAFTELYSNSAAIFLNFATPTGGTYFVNGEQTNVFNPSELGEGTHQVRYSYEDTQSGCSDEMEILVKVGGERLLNFRDRSFCQNDAVFQFVLDGGAIFVDNMQLDEGAFNPAIYTAGTYNAVWKKDGFADSEFSLSVHEVPSVIYVEVPDQCSDNAPLDLTNFVEPKMGSFSGPGLENSTQFNPAIGKGTYHILYNIANAYCYSELAMEINVNELEDMCFEGLHLVCENAAAVDLKQFVSPSGGIFSCADGGVIDNTLYPSMLSVGAHTITYTVEASGCSKTEEQLMYIIEAEPIVSDESVFASIYANSSPLYLDFASPKGGTYYVDGMQTGIFDPQQLGQGVHTIDYYLEDNRGCTTDASISVTVKGQKLSNYADRKICRNEAALDFDLDGGRIFVDNAQLASGSFNPANYTPGIYSAVWKKDGFADTDFTITVRESPEITTFSVPVLCKSDAAINLYDYVEPKTGSFSGLSLTNAEYFDPSKFKGGTYTVAYTVKNDICLTIAEIKITVEGSENVVFEGLPYTICSGSNAIDLMEYVYPATGSFTNDDGAVIDDVLYPSMLSAGIHTLTYTIPNQQGCDQVSEKRIYILEDEIVALTMETNICKQADAFLMTGGYPIGGEYYVDGQHVIVLDPSTYAEGLHTVEYRYNNMYGCESSVSQHISILKSPDVTLQLPQTLCDNGEALMLRGGYPYGGQYAVNGKYMESFDPSVYGQGEYVLSYEYSNGECKITRKQALRVVASSAVTIYEMQDLCNNATPVKLYGGSPAGGSYAVDGRAVTVLDPSDFTSGSHTLTYKLEQNACISSVSTRFNILETENFTVNVPSVCENDDVFTLTIVSPSGGQYVGSGVVNNQLDPSLIGAGSFYYEYHYRSSNGCSSVVPFTITINAAPVIEMPNVSNICSNANAFTLSATPWGGQFSGNGVVNNVYYPELASDGIQNITYQVKNKYGCSAEKSKSILVHEPKELLVEDMEGICQNGEPIELNFVSPSGGDYSGTGVVENVLYPEKTTAGVKTIRYTYTDRNACVSELQTKVTVRESPDMDDFYLSTLCTNDDEVELDTEMFYTKSVYTGKGVTNNSFDPALAGPGESTIRYLVVDEYGCSNYSQKSVKVNEAPFVYLQAKTYCQNSSEVELKGAYPTGGTYTGNFVVNNSFMPVTTGIYDIRYNYTADNGCSEVTSNYITVNEVPDVQMDVIPNICVNSEPLLLQGAAPSGGKYYLTGQENDPVTAFNPAINGVGTYTLNYSFANAAGCAGNASRTFQVMETEDVSILGMNSQYCANAASFSLNQKAYPSGGTFKLNGDMVNTLEPSFLNTGINKLEYTYESTSGCRVSTSKNIMIARVPPSPIMDLKSIYCPGDQITIEPSNYVEEYNIVVQVPGAELTKVENGRKSYGASEVNTIDIYYESALGCMSPVKSYAIEVEHRNPSFVTEVQNIDKGEALQILALDNYDYITDYVWTFSDGGISYAPQPYHYFNIEGKNSFYLDYTTNSGCTFSKDWVDYIWVKNTDGLTTAIDERASAKIKLYPNPATRVVNIIPGQSEKYTIAIFSKTGQMLRMVPDLYGEQQVDVRQFAPGAYSIRLIFSDKAASTVFIKQ